MSLLFLDIQFLYDRESMVSISLENCKSRNLFIELVFISIFQTKYNIHTLGEALQTPCIFPCISLIGLSLRATATAYPDQEGAYSVFDWLTTCKLLDWGTRSGMLFIKAFPSWLFTWINKSGFGWGESLRSVFGSQIAGRLPPLNWSFSKMDHEKLVIQINNIFCYLFHVVMEL